MISRNSSLVLKYWLEPTEEYAFILSGENYVSMKTTSYKKCRRPILTAKKALCGELRGPQDSGKQIEVVKRH